MQTVPGDEAQLVASNYLTGRETDGIRHFSNAPRTMADGFDRVVPSPSWGHRVFLMASSRGIRSREEVEEIVKTCGSVRSVFESLKVDELKNFLRDRDLNLSGKKWDLSEKVFGAAKLGIGKCATTEEDKTTKENEKKQRLALDSPDCPDISGQQ